MSRARRLAHRHLVARRITQRRAERRAEACRVVHWRDMLKTMHVDAPRRPVDQPVSVVTVSARCRVHRGPGVMATAVITDLERRLAQDSEEMEDIAINRVQWAVDTIKRALVPFRHRREMGVE